jgi:hypothetical protein
MTGIVRWLGKTSTVSLLLTSESAEAQGTQTDWSPYFERNTYRRLVQKVLHELGATIERE